LDERQKKLQKIYEQQDARKGNDKRLQKLLADNDATIRARATEAYCSIQDTTATENLVKLLRDDNEKVKIAAAFALGQTAGIMSEAGRAKTENRIFNDSLFTTAQMISEFGKFCTAQGLKKFAEYFSEEKNMDKKEAVLLGISRAGYRNVSAHEATMLSLKWFSHNKNKVCGNAVLALLRIGKTQEIMDSLDILINAVKDRDANLRSNLAALLGKINEPNIVLPPLVTIADDDKNWQPRVSALRAFGKLSIEKYQGILFSVLPALHDTNEHISLEAIATLRTLSTADSLHENLKEETWDDLLKIVENNEGKYSFRQQGEASVVLLKLFRERGKNYVKPQAKIAKQLNAKYIEAQAFLPDEEAFQMLLGYISSQEPLWARTAIEATQIFLQMNFSRERAEQAYTTITESLLSNDVAVVATAATVLGDTLFAREALIPLLIATYKKQKEPDGIEVMQEIISALGKIKSKKAVSFLEQQLKNTERTVSVKSAEALKIITGKDYSKKITAATSPKRKDHDWDYLFSIPEKPQVEITTTKGKIVIELFPNEAPFTVMNFLKLIQKKYYDTTFFHRVVGNFVIQGGDPRGDGWGGPGYTIRSEFSTLRYDDQGIVGMASAGKDTEGSQFFITHTITPHLDGRYTIFGKVISGMEVVNKIMIGDEITEINIQK
jgi:peptidylprolyl isomerase